MSWFKWIILLYASAITLGLTINGAINLPNSTGAFIFGIPAFAVMLMLAIDGAVSRSGGG